MINLFYEESYWKGKMNGPHKVVKNLIKSLEQENINFSINEEKYEHNFLLQYDEKGHQKHYKINHRSSCIIGPQFFLFDEYGQFLINYPQYYKKLISPCQWLKKLYTDKFHLPENKISIWPVGIDLLNTTKKVKYDCLIYFKHRSVYELKIVKKFFDSIGLTYRVLSYGSYNDSDLERFCNECRFCFLLNGTESQGISAQEIMSTNTPLLVWDRTAWIDKGVNFKVPATSVPYWSEDCGKIFFDEDDMESSFLDFYSKIEQYCPRIFIEDNLSFKESVNKLIKILDENILKYT